VNREEGKKERRKKKVFHFGAPHKEEEGKALGVLILFKGREKKEKKRVKRGQKEVFPRAKREKNDKNVLGRR
jgi:hypothetical protein